MRLGLAVLSAVLLNLCFPLAGPLPVWRTVFVWVGAAPLLVALLGSEPGRRPLWQGFFTGWVFGFLCARSQPGQAEGLQDQLDLQRMHPPNHCGDLFFHTQPQDSPWIDFDLGAVKSVHRVEVTNRSDCCQERAIPLIVEVSVDDKQWIQVARRDTDFAAWTATFPKQKARYVRFRVPRSTTLHFDDVVIR